MREGPKTLGNQRKSWSFLGPSRVPTKFSRITRGLKSFYIFAIIFFFESALHHSRHTPMRKIDSGTLLVR